MTDTSADEARRGSSVPLKPLQKKTLRRSSRSGHTLLGRCENALITERACASSSRKRGSDDGGLIEFKRALAIMASVV